MKQLINLIYSDELEVFFEGGRRQTFKKLIILICVAIAKRMKFIERDENLYF